VVLQTLITCIKKVPKKSKLIVLATTSSLATLESLELLDAFNVTLHVPSLGTIEAIKVLKELGIGNISDIEPVLRTVTKGIPIKKLMLVIEMSLEKGAVLDPERFEKTLQETGLLD
jgi:vesicle-fusing ATPase